MWAFRKPPEGTQPCHLDFRTSDPYGTVREGWVWFEYAALCESVKEPEEYSYSWSITLMTFS